MSKSAGDIASATTIPDGSDNELTYLTSDPKLRVSARNRAFLKYIGEAAIEGRSSCIKAYSIAVDVFGRSADFDANIDPIVRIEATRIRQALDHYYISHGAQHAIHIHLPRGRYVPEFEVLHVAKTETVYQLVAIRQKPVTELPRADVTDQFASGSVWLFRPLHLVGSLIARVLK